MQNKDFKELLKKANLTKKAFSELFGTSTQSVNNWGSNGRDIPYWVKSWLTLYVENKNCEELKQIIRKNVCEED